MDELMELVNTVFRAGRGRMRECFPTMFCEENVDNVLIIREDGRIVSHIGVCVRDVIAQGVRYTVGNVGAVCTHDEYRKRGHAQAILRDCNEKLRSDGVDLLFVSGDRSLYRRHGCARVGRVDEFSIPAESAADLGSAVAQVSLWDIAQLDEFVALHRQEPVRFHRPVDDWHAFVREGSAYPFLNRERRFYDVGLDGRRAYVVLHLSEDDSGRHGWVAEYAGSRSALAGGIGGLIKEEALKDLVWPVPEWDLTLRAAFAGFGFASWPVSTGGTVCILDLPRLAEKLKHLFLERASKNDVESLKFAQDSDGWSVSSGADRLTFGGDDSGEGWRGVGQLIFGSVDGSHMKDWPDNALTRILQKIFPLPRPEYGLSYI